MKPLIRPYLSFKKSFQSARKDVLVLILFGVLVLVTRYPYRSEYLFEGDSVNYALALDRFDASQSRPHPPGYIFYVGTARLFYFFFQEQNTALLAASLLFSILTVVVLYLLVKDLFSRTVAVVTSFLFLTAPYFWFYGDVALAYAVSAFWACLLAFLCCRIFLSNKKKQYISLTAVFLGLSGGFRPDTMFFMAPLVVYSLFMNWPGWKHVFKASVLFGLCVLAWYIPLVMFSGGYASYSHAASDQFSFYVAQYSLVFGNPLSAHIKMIKNLLLVLIGSSCFAVPYITFLCVSKKELLQSILNRHKIIFLGLWILPALLFFAVIFFEQYGYILNILPAVYILFGCAVVTFTERFIRIGRQRFALSIHVGILCILHAAIFISPPYVDFGRAVGKSFEEKTWTDAAKSMLFVSIYRHTYGQIVRDDSTNGSFTQAIQQLPYRPDEVNLLLFHRSFWSIKLAAFYLPEYESYIIPDWREHIDKIWYGKRRDLKEIEPPQEVVLSPDVRVLAVFCDGEAPAFKELSAQVPMKRIQVDVKRYFFLIEANDLPIKFQKFIFTKKRIGMESGTPSAAAISENSQTRYRTNTGK